MSVEKVRAELGEDAKLVVIEEIGKVIKVAFKEYIHGEKGKQAWNRVNNVIKELGGEWVSEGKLSRWQIPKKEGMSTVTSDQKAVLIKDLFTYLDSIEKQASIAKEKLKELQT